MKTHLLVIPLALAISPTSYARPLTPVRLDFLEALAPRDTTSSEEFRKQFESSVAQGVRLTATRLRTCGYRLEPHTSFYNASDTLQATEKASVSQQAGSWMIVGPRRSDHYILVAKGAETTPSVSLMAGASEIEKLGPLHLSVYASNPVLAEALAQFAKTEHQAKTAATYLTVVSEDCLYCKDFSRLFDEAAKKRGLEKLQEIPVITETPDTEPVVAAALSLKPTYVVLPNYSKVSTQIMAAIQDRLPSTTFLGGDGWGDGQFGFVDRNPSLSTAKGFTVRGFPPVEQGLQKFAIGKASFLEGQKGEFSPKSGPGMAILRILQGTTDLLCQHKPKSAQAFSQVFSTSGRKFFSAPWGVSIYQLAQARITYLKESPLKVSQGKKP